jgi:hypothetical protein
VSELELKLKQAEDKALTAIKREGEAKGLGVAAKGDPK